MTTMTTSSPSEWDVVAGRNLYSKGFPTNRIPVKIPSTGQNIVMRETTVIELKSISKTIIDNFNRRQMDVIYEAVTEYLQAMILTEGVDVSKFTEFDRLYCLMVFFQVSFYRDPITYKCPHCGVEIVYRYDMSKYLSKMVDAYVEDQVVEIQHKNKIYKFTLGWPTTNAVSSMNKHFYNDIGDVTEDMERTQYGIHYVLSFVKKVAFRSRFSEENDAEVNLEELEDFGDRLECLNALPSIVMFDENNGVFAKVTGFFINRLENCFCSEICPQCHKETDYGLPQSSLFYSLFYGMLRSLYGFILQVEVLCLYRYGVGIFDQEIDMTYNDLQSLVKQLQSTEEKSARERQKIGKDNFTKGLYWIREILNCLIFPEDRKKGRE